MTESLPRLFLAPMEGVTDWVMRDILTEIGGIDQCVTEFLRITDQVMPDHIFLKNCPELNTGSRTRSGVPVFIQLLGGQAQALAANAAKAVELGTLGVDLNFGCPAPTVNRHDGGATLLKYTDRLFQIVKTVRQAVPSHIPVTAKMRLGFDDPSRCLENAIAIQEAGASWLTIHCRTKTDGYKPPAFWEWIPKIKEKVHIPLVTNGEIWTSGDFQSCYEQTKTMGYMVGRGAVKNPFLFLELKNSLNETTFNSADLSPAGRHQENLEVRTYETINKFFDLAARTVSPKFATARTKGWLKQISPISDKNTLFFNDIKIITDPKDFQQKLSSSLKN